MFTVWLLQLVSFWDIIPFNYLGTNVSAEHAVSIFITKKGGSLFLRNIYINLIELRGITNKIIPVETLLSSMIIFIYIWYGPLLWQKNGVMKRSTLQSGSGWTVGIRIKYIPHISQHVTTMPTCWFQTLTKETLDKDYISLAYKERVRLPLSWEALLSTFLQEYKSTALVKEGFLCEKRFVFFVLRNLVQLRFNHCPGRKHCR